MELNNILKNLPAEPDKEVFEVILSSDLLKLERIISNGQTTPDSEWYDQENDEWVMLIEGSAALKFHDSGDLVVLKPGDYLNIPAHVKHRVEYTDKAKITVWLALHYKQIND